MPNKKKVVKEIKEDVFEEKNDVSEPKTEQAYMPEEKKSGSHNLIKLTVSGTFRTKVATDEDMQDFDGVTGFIPECDEEYYISYAERMLELWIKKSKYKDKTFRGRIKIYVDNTDRS